MHAVRVPILGVAIAVALLLIENLGAVAYRDVEQRDREQTAAAEATRQAAAAAEAQKREIEALIDQLEELDRQVEQLMNEINNRRGGCENARRFDR